MTFCEGLVHGPAACAHHRDTLEHGVLDLPAGEPVRHGSPLAQLLSELWAQTRLWTCWWTRLWAYLWSPCGRDCAAAGAAGSLCRTAASSAKEEMPPSLALDLVP